MGTSAAYINGQVGDAEVTNQSVRFALVIFLGVHLMYDVA